MFNYSSFFGGFGSSGSGSGGLGINFSEYRMIKSGSYKKLMKAYYAEQKSTSSSKTSKQNRSIIEKLAEEKKQINEKNLKGVQSLGDTTGLSQMKSKADSLKTAAKSFDTSGVFQKKDGSYDTEKIAKSVNDFVSKYNSVLDQAGKVSAKEVSQQVNYMQSMTNTMSKSLEQIGITIGKDGKLTVNEDTLKNADMKNVKALFSGAHSYASEIAGRAEDIGSAVLRSSSFYSGNGTLYSSVASGGYNSQV